MESKKRIRVIRRFSSWHCLAAGRVSVGTAHPTGDRKQFIRIRPGLHGAWVAHAAADVEKCNGRPFYEKSP